MWKRRFVIFAFAVSLGMASAWAADKTADRGHSSPLIQYASLNGGHLVLCGIGMFTPAGSPLRNFAILTNGAAVQSWGFNDLSGSISGTQFQTVPGY
jgi:hypothetical protein